MSKRDSWKTIFLVCIFCAVEAIGSSAQTFKTLLSFNGTDGSYPGGYPFPIFSSGPLVQGIDGNFYGTTVYGGSYGDGTVFRITPGGTLTTLHNFEGTDGIGPNGLVQGTDGNFYGTTVYGGANDDCFGTFLNLPGCGTVFKITAAGKLTTLHSFDVTDGGNPSAGLVQGTDGNLYGTTEFGGDILSFSCGLSGCGTVFKITPGGTLTTLHSFDGTDGVYPAALIQATNGDFYGTEFHAVFEITAGGTVTTLSSFCGRPGSPPDCEGPYALLQAADGNFYGTTFGVCHYSCGTVFKITPGGKLTTLGAGLRGADALIQATDGNFYGTTYYGGAYDLPVCFDTYEGGCGTVFKITPGGTLTTLHSFDETDGAGANGLVQGTNGTFYGTTNTGGAYASCDDGFGCGTVFGLAVGLGPFVETLPTSGKAETPVTILGNNLAGATGVTFDCRAATFKVLSGSEITTTVPKGATTGKVKVKTPHGTLTSNVNFRVTP